MIYKTAYKQQSLGTMRVRLCKIKKNKKWIRNWRDVVWICITVHPKKWLL